MKKIVFAATLAALCGLVAFGEYDQVATSFTTSSGSLDQTNSLQIKGVIDSIVIVASSGKTTDVDVATAEGESILSVDDVSGTAVYRPRVPVCGVTGVDLLQVGANSLLTNNWAEAMLVVGNVNVILDNILTSGTYTVYFNIEK